MLSVIRKGSGRPLILLHGNGESAECFRPHLEYWKTKYDVCAINTRGHGLTPRGSGAFTIRRFSEDLFAFCQEQNFHHAYLLGFSDGGNIALRFLCDHPNIVSKAVICGANRTPSGLTSDCLSSICREWLSVAIPSVWKEEARRKRELLSLMLFQPHIRKEELKKIKIPVLITAGQNDVIRLSHTKELAATLPHAKLQILPGGHSGIYDDPPLYEKVADEFFEILQKRECFCEDSFE